MGNSGFLNKLITPKDTTVFDRTLDILIALLPAAIAGCVYFGMHALLMLLCCMVSAVVAAFLSAKLLGVREDVRDLSALVCGLLIAMTMPSGFSIPAAMVCTVAAVIVARVMFGGNGCEIVSPVAFGAVLCFLCFPGLFYYNEAFTNLPTQITSGFTLRQLIFGAHAGAIGETPAVFLLLGALYLCLRRVISPVIPVFAVAFTALFSFLFGVDVLTAILGGGVLLAAIFILPDRNLAPSGFMGQIAYSAAFALLTVIIRRYAAVEEGVYFAALTVNLIRPLFEAIPEIKKKGEKPYEKA
ncbi:MAG: RnfABCDGE type electron transport complex subunit D [Clostridia bacterium]|nr:RnfABCDGE type electron transport complex subunit D [Clostridia bacterium]